MRMRSIIVGLLGLASIAGCGDGKPAAPAPGAPTRIRLQLNWVPEPEFGGIYAAQFDGLYRDAGLEVEIIKDPGGAAVPQMSIPECVWKVFGPRRISAIPRLLRCSLSRRNFRAIHFSTMSRKNQIGFLNRSTNRQKRQRSKSFSKLMRVENGSIVQ